MINVCVCVCWRNWNISHFDIYEIYSLLDMTSTCV